MRGKCYSCFNALTVMSVSLLSSCVQSFFFLSFLFFFFDTDCLHLIDIVCAMTKSCSMETVGKFKSNEGVCVGGGGGDPRSAGQ